jgi:hypothetical protein
MKLEDILWYIIFIMLLFLILCTPTPYKIAVDILSILIAIVAWKTL